MANENDQRLVEEAKVTPERFGDIYKKYGKKVYNYFWYRTKHDPDVSEDLKEETFMRAFTHLKTFKSKGYSYLTYLLRIAHNLLINHSKKQRTVSLDEISEDGNEMALEDTTIEPIESVVIEDKKKTEEEVAEVLKVLSPKEQTLVHMKYDEEMKNRDIANKLHRSENAIKIAFSRIKKKISKKASKKIVIN